MLRKDHFNRKLWSQGGSVSLPRRAATGGEDTSQPVLSVVLGVHECPTCGLFQHMPVLEPGQVASCMRCDGHLDRRRKTSEIMAPMAFCVASLAIYIALLIDVLMTLDVFGRENTVALFSGPMELVSQGFGELAMLVAIASIIMPGVVLVLMGVILYGAMQASMPVWVRPCLAWYGRLRPWSMIEVYVIGVIVAYTKLVDIAVVLLQPGIFLLGSLMITMAALDSTFDSEMIWRHRSVDFSHGLTCYDAHKNPMPPGSQMVACESCHLVFKADSPIESTRDMGDCPRCGQILRRRKRESVRATMAFLLAALIFYLPANLLPVMTYSKVGHAYPNTIISGVIELWTSDLYFLALLVLFASITVPVLKIISLFTMVYCETKRRTGHLKFLSKLYRVVCFIGRWSMIDVFMISILVAVVRFSFMARITADPGVIFFALVVVLTIFAADLYDPRGLWDAAGMNRNSSPAGLPAGINKSMEAERA